MPSLQGLRQPYVTEGPAYVRPCAAAKALLLACQPLTQLVVAAQWERHPRRFSGQPPTYPQLGALRLDRRLRQRVGHAANLSISMLPVSASALVIHDPGCSLLAEIIGGSRCVCLGAVRNAVHRVSWQRTSQLWALRCRHCGDHNMPCAEQLLAFLALTSIRPQSHSLRSETYFA